MYIKVGTYEISKQTSDKCLQSLKRTLNYLPSLINWAIKCPDHVTQMKELYPHYKF